MPQIRSWEDIWTRLRDNWDGYVREYHILLVLLLLASLADAASTIHFMIQRGAGAELHPTVRSVSYLFGPVLGPILGKAVQVVVVVVLTVYFRRRAIFIFIPVIILYAWAAWYNVWGHHLYYPNLLWILDRLAV
ncbi:MAG: hypothetical protein ABFE13_21990 [Phycisphaerales bacterium]